MFATTRMIPVLTAAAAMVVLASALPRPASAQWPPERLENLKVLPEDISVRELIGVMRGFAGGLVASGLANRRAECECGAARVGHRWWWAWCVDLLRANPFAADGAASKKPLVS